MKDISIVFGILARSCETQLNKNIQKIEKFRSNFKNSALIIVENDSNDNTRHILEKWKNKSENIYLPVVVEENLDQLERIERMTICRNYYLKTINDISFEPDFLIVFDIDLDFDLIYEEFCKIIENAPEDWTGLFSNGRFYYNFLNKNRYLSYYDLFAYLPEDSEILDKNQKELFYDGNKLEKLLKKNKYVKCDSAFGGIAIYKYKCIKNALYKTIPNKRSELFTNICEHILFNKTIAENGSLYIVSNFKLLYEKIEGRNLIWFFIRKIFGLKGYYNFRNFYLNKIKHIETKV